MVIALLLVVGVTFKPQDIPEGVRYRKASEALNKAAEAKIRTLLSPKTKAFILGEKIVLCRPSLWQEIKGKASPALLNAKRLNLVIPDVGRFDSRYFVQPGEFSELWPRVRGLFANKGPIQIRKARAEELSYYWAFIPYDLDEPILVAEAKGVRMLFDFGAGAPDDSLIMVELLGRRLR